MQWSWIPEGGNSVKYTTEHNLIVRTHTEDPANAEKEITGQKKNNKQFEETIINYDRFQKGNKGSEIYRT